jgi:hypothetical protein
MTAPAADRAIHIGLSAPVRQLHSSNSGIPHINPATGLSTDYLNHFAEALMLLEMAATTPKFVSDLQAWRPRTYCEHFARSRFSNRDAVIAGYQAADPAVREALDAAAATLNAALVRCRDMVIANLATATGEDAAPQAAAWLKPLIRRLAAVINGSPAAGLPPSQSEIDAMFGR